ncbi:hypothetical protein RAD15_24410 [Bradyrhizobium sp. 14AA]
MQSYTEGRPFSFHGNHSAANETRTCLSTDLAKGNIQPMPVDDIPLPASMANELVDRNLATPVSPDTRAKARQAGIFQQVVTDSIEEPDGRGRYQFETFGRPRHWIYNGDIHSAFGKQG